MMKPHPAPTRPGWYWARLIHPANQPEGEDWKSSDWEIAEVVDNYGEDDETFAVMFTGIGPAQWIPNCVFGPEIAKPEELK